MYPLTRLRRTRMYKWSRNIVKENVISSSDLILPIFIKEGKKKEEEISSMPDVYKYSIDNLEKIAQEFDGVEKVYAIQAGREVRVMVRPEDVTDEGVYKLSQDIAERIEKEMDYPGEVKVNLVRETRAIAIAH